jgi:ubiquinol-cytochrome c reductase cytochrome c1 subunit
MKKLFLLSLMMMMPMFAQAAATGVQLDSIQVDASDKASLQRGMKTYVNYCLGCHTSEYQRYIRAAEDLHMPPELVVEHLIFSGQKVGEQMTNAMDPKLAANWFGAAPPDLTNEVNLRGADWVYTYLRSFYADDSRPYGVNNVVFPSVGMPNVLSELQGVQSKTCGQVTEYDAHGAAVIDSLTGKPMTVESCEILSVAQGSGSMTPAEFDATIYDLTNFMAYMSKPYKTDSQRIGMWAILFTLLMTVVFYFLKKEFWRDVK